MVNLKAPGLKAGRSSADDVSIASGEVTAIGVTMSDMAEGLENYFIHKPVIDETGLTNTYDIKLRWNGKLRGNAEKKGFENALREQLGLELVPARQSIEMLVVEKAN